MAKSAADGYTMYLATTGALLSPILTPKSSYDLFKDSAPVALAATVLVAHPSLPVKAARDLAALSTPENFNAFLRSEFARWGKVIRAAGIHAD